MEAANDQPWHFEAPLDRRGLRMRTTVALVAMVLLLAAGVGSSIRGSSVGTVLGIFGAAVFALLALTSWRLSRIEGPPLVLDERGMAFDDGLRPRAFVPWEKIANVDLRASGFGRRVVVTLAGDEGVEVTLPSACYGGAPVEWIAGIIETFRQHAIHRRA